MPSATELDLSSKGIALGTINRVLGWVGLLLVVAHDDGDDGERQPTRLWVERVSTYDARCVRQALERTVTGHGETFEDAYGIALIELGCNPEDPRLRWLEREVDGKIEVSVHLGIEGGGPCAT